jgi:peptidoglycan/LPS O-acetylase OafA/YrhL
MNKTWKLIVAGILDIIGGASSFAGGFYIAIAIVPHPDLGTDLRWIFSSGVALLVIAGVLAVIGGLHAFQRKRWRLALIGAISAFLSIMPLALVYSYVNHPSWALAMIPGIIAILLTVLSKKEFRESTELAKSVKARDYTGKKMREEVERIREGIKRVPKR